MINTFNFNKWNNLLGWASFFIALIVYGLTVEPTASYWDCAEYISTSAKLQVGHPPGAPLFQMLGAFFAFFAIETDQIARMVNYMSVFSSAFTILFLFWSLTLFLKRVIGAAEELTALKGKAILASGFLGALTFTFTDTFWFNAVEAEVYAMATFILALLFWLGLRWEQDLDDARGDRWFILICFVIGLSFGVHFMGLLAIPAIGLLYYFKKFPKFSWRGFIWANLISMGALLFIFQLLLPSVLKFFAYLEVFFVNSFGLPFNSGTIIAAILLVAAFYWALRYTRAKGYVHTHNISLGILFILIGFSSWIMIPIRSSADTSINENSPSDARLLLAYYNLEQYPETHLFYGPMYTDMYAPKDPIHPYKDDKPKYERDTKSGKYVIVNDYKDALLNANSEQEGLLPRLWSPEHAVNYMKWVGTPDFTINPDYSGNPQVQQLVNQFLSDYRKGNVDEEDYHKFLQEYGQILEIERPSFWKNIQFLVQYQIANMYMRYFFWNFIGRQNDIQWQGDVLNGNVLTGINMLDSHSVISQEHLSSDMKNNKARNLYFGIPFLLGLFGLFFLALKNPKQFWVLFMFFLVTGLAIQIYTNVRPYEPRERDYAFVGSFYVYCMWVGMGLYALFDLFSQRWKSKFLLPTLTGVLLIIGPGLLAKENWDDHDRSGRYTAQSIAKAYLDSCQKDAIIFTIGDNDTFALWYAQEIEEYRTDVRTINTSLFSADWYIDQMKRQIYESKPIPSQLDHSKYAWGVNDFIIYEPIPGLDTLRLNIKDFMNWISKDGSDNKLENALRRTRPNDISAYPKSQLSKVFYPTNKIRLPVNKEKVLANGIVRPEDADKIVDYIDIDLPKSSLGKNRILMLDILANNDWERPIYFTGGSFDNAEYMWMKDYLQLEGLTYKLVPIQTPINPSNPYQMGRIDAEGMYQTVKKWDWGNSNSPHIYHDPETRKNSISFRTNLSRLMDELIKQGKNDKALEIADLAMEKMPIEYFGYYSLVEPFVDGYYKLDENEKARNLYDQLAQKYKESLNYFAHLDLSTQRRVGEDIISDVERYRSLLGVVIKNRDKGHVEKAVDEFISASASFANLYGEYDFYTLMDAYVAAYYEAGKKDKARELYQKIATQYKDQLTFVTQLDPETQQRYQKQIFRDVEDYRNLVDIVIIHDDSIMIREESKKFNELLKKLSDSSIDEERDSLDKEAQ